MRQLLVALAVTYTVGCASAGVPPAPTAADIANLEARLDETKVDAPLAIRLAYAYRRGERGEDARTLLERTLQQHPNDARATVLLGLVYEDLGMYAQARQLYRSYIDSGASRKLRNEFAGRLPLLQRKELQASARAAVAREVELANTPPTPWTVAVFPFEFVGGDPQYQPLGRALAELMVNDLSQTSRLRVLERAQVQLLIDEMRLTEAGRVDEATAARTGRMLGAERVVHGSLDAAPNNTHVETSIVRVTSNAWPGESAQTSLSESDHLNALIDMQKRVALRVYESLGIELTPAERERVTRRATQNLMALLAYGRGLAAEDAGDFAAAAQHFAEAARLDPNFTEAREAEARSSATAEAAEVDTEQLAARVVADAAPPPAITAAAIIPNPIARDASVEVLGTEGAGTTMLILIIRRP